MKYKKDDIIMFSSEKYAIEKCRARVTNFINGEISEIEPLDVTFKHDNFRNRRRHYPVEGDITHGLFYLPTLPEELFTI